ncbi:molybdopterin synthase catalytic subunit MoaE [Thalassotalea litorea]|uniref:molybdopterin synthase catalytic subunit MoaE n=1 Tax=Thalassotalea litorea TaxID=2020715 RepID=UPI003734D928
MTDFISIQTQDFSVDEQLQALEANNVSDGATVIFTGRVRNKNDGQQVHGLYLEHYPEMTEKALARIIAQARQRWQINRVRVIHRIGQLSIGEQIVFVGVSSAHRGDAYAANEFIMDYLKIEAPFWKKETTEQGDKWLDAKQQDNQKAQSW